MAPKRIFQLSGTCNNYPWGKQGKESLAAQLCAKTPGTDFKIEDDKPYSEMWFGDYPDFPARVLETGELLADVLKKDPDTLLGKKVVKELDGQLPFLPKILSIAKALPLQLHPNKDLATKLHKKDPSFTDPNHKPEIALALSKFEVFAGFKPLAQIQPLFTTLNSLHQFVPSNAPKDWTNETLREVCRNLLTAPDDTVKQVEDALASTPEKDFGDAQTYIPKLLPRLQNQYSPQDAGSLVALLTMNFLVFEPGDAIYIPADGIHAYLSGDIVECMARSNNVLNAGFCPRAERNSVDLFCNTLTFSAHSKEDVVLKSEKSERSGSGKTKVYRPDMREFDMLATKLESGEAETIKAGEGPGVMIVTEGEGKLKGDGGEFELKAGGIYYVAPGVEIDLSSEGGLQAFMAAV